MEVAAKQIISEQASKVIGVFIITVYSVQFLHPFVLVQWLGNVAPGRYYTVASMATDAACEKYRVGQKTAHGFLCINKIVI